MKYGLSRVQSRRPSRTSLFVGTIVVVMLIVIDLFTHGAVRTLTRAIVTPLLNISITVGYTVLQGDTWKKHAQLQQENDALKQQVAEYQSRELLFTYVYNENQQYLKILHSAIASSTVIKGRIISNPRASLFGTLLIDRGYQDGIKESQIVATANGFVIGTISHVDTQVSEVSLLLAPQKTIDVLINGNAVHLQGRGGGNGYAVVSRDVPIAVGDIVTSYQSHQHMIGIVGGVVPDIVRGENEIYISSTYSIEGLSSVYVYSQYDK